MNVRSLEAYGVPSALLEVWRARYGERLLPVQQRAVCDCGVLAGRSVVVFAPTSAGKTFVGEMAATKAAADQRRALYLVPTKALAEEKFRQFAEAYGPLGLRVAITTRDRASRDAEIRLGKFDIAVGVNEKLRGLVARAPDLLHKVGALVADELQVLGDRERGPCLEMLLTLARRVIPPPQIVGLSAVLGRERHLADWLGAAWLRVDERPIELRKGVLFAGELRYLEHNSGREGVEEWPAVASAETEAETMLALARYLGDRGEQTIVFLPTKRDCREFAFALTERVNWHQAEAAIEELRALPPTHARQALSLALQGAVAFHNADLDWAERDVVERAFRSGEVRVLCATSTLANGVNLPARNVIADVAKWDARAAAWGGPDALRGALTELSKAEFENMSGRAGRLGCEEVFGRAILVAESAFRRDLLWHAYVRSDFVSVEPALACAPAAQVPLLSACLAAGGSGERAVQQLLAETYSGHLSWSGEVGRRELDSAVSARLARLADLGLVSRGDGRIEVTPLGAICAAQGLEEADFCWLREWDDAAKGVRLSEEEALFIAATTPSGRRLAFPVRRRAAEDPRAALFEHCRQSLPRHLDLLPKLLREPRLSVAESDRAAAEVLAMVGWLGPDAIEEVERHLRAPAGALANLAEGLAWLVESLVRLGEEIGWERDHGTPLLRLAARLPSGLPPDAVGLAGLRVPGLGRDLLRRLAGCGKLNEQAVAAMTRAELGQVLPGAVADRVFRLVGRRARRASDGDVSARPDRTPKREKPESVQPPGRVGGEVAPHLRQPVLLLERSNPKRLFVSGREVRINPVQHRLAEALATRPGECVSYAELHDRIWGPEEIVVQGMIYTYKSRLLRRIREALGRRAPEDLIITVPRRGMLLNLSPEQVQVR